MKLLKSLFIVGSLLLFAGVMTSCEEEEITLKTDGEEIASTPDID
ncbi:hypothetical protein [Fulvivirga lutimaris]|nr:hypothetical protein [Fulvivirga lutimaris]